MANTKRLVLDVLKPHRPSILEMAQNISDLERVDSVNAILCELDEKVENIKVTIVGDNLDIDNIKKCIKKLGGSVHSIDEAVCGNEIIEEVKTPQG